MALLVGAFLIFNTFTIIVAQRTRELALLRCLGASRRQVMTSVLLESLIVAVVASLVGLGLGVLIANGLKALLTGILNFDLPTTGTVFLWRTVIVSLAVGIVVTVLAALLPARKATRVPPVAALQPETAFAPTQLPQAPDRARRARHRRRGRPCCWPACSRTRATGWSTSPRAR